MFTHPPLPSTNHSTLPPVQNLRYPSFHTTPSVPGYVISSFTTVTPQGPSTNPSVNVVKDDRDTKIKESVKIILIVDGLIILLFLVILYYVFYKNSILPVIPLFFCIFMFSPFMFVNSELAYDVSKSTKYQKNGWVILLIVLTFLMWIGLLVLNIRYDGVYYDKRGNFVYTKEASSPQVVDKKKW
jgi:hypothetical protein